MLDKEGNATTLTTMNFEGGRTRRGATTVDDTVTVPATSIGWRDLEALESDAIGRNDKGRTSGSEEKFQTEIHLRSLQTRNGSESSGTVRVENDE